MPRAKLVLSRKDTDVFVLQVTKGIAVNQVPDYCTSDTIFNNLVIITEFLAPVEWIDLLNLISFGGVDGRGGGGGGVCLEGIVTESKTF